ncbi:MAG: hypothetical protein M0Z48_12745 [Nitrospiraceae bacterium]|nr:hypothetical protein [Nitrospiraceae bacterium]
MKRPAEKTEDFLNLMVDWQATEYQMIEYAGREAPKTKIPLIKTMLHAMEFEAKKRCLIQQMLIESVKKEAVNLDPEDLQALSAHLNRQIEAEEKALPLAEAALEKSELFMPRFLLSYLVSELKKENSLLRQFEDEVKGAAISTSAGSKLFDSGKTGAL